VKIAIPWHDIRSRTISRNPTEDENGDVTGDAGAES